MDEEWREAPRPVSGHVENLGTATRERKTSAPTDSLPRRARSDAARALRIGARRRGGIETRAEVTWFIAAPATRARTGASGATRFRFVAGPRLPHRDHDHSAFVDRRPGTPARRPGAGRVSRGAILGFSERALRSVAEDSSLHHDIGNVIVAGERGRTLVQRILSFSRGIGERVPVHVEKVVREALDPCSRSSWSAATSAMTPCCVRSRGEPTRSSSSRSGRTRSRRASRACSAPAGRAGLAGFGRSMRVPREHGQLRSAVHLFWGASGRFLTAQ